MKARLLSIETNMTEIDFRQVSAIPGRLACCLPDIL
jgi:hypothetical protein